jgi:hypothetical protein
MPLRKSPFYMRILSPLREAVCKHAVALEHLSGEGIKLNHIPVELNTVIDLGFAQLSGLEFSHLFSAFNGSRVLGTITETTSPDGAPPGRYFMVIRPSLIQGKNRSGIFEEESGSAGMYLSSLYMEHFFLLERAPKLLGTIALYLSATVAYGIGLRHIELLAAGGRGTRGGSIGYKVWPKLGFDIT